MIRRLFSALCLLAATSFAAEVPVDTKILSIAIDEPLSGVYFHNGSEIVAFQANLTGLGEPLAYKGPRRFELRASEAEFSLAPPLPAPLASVELPLNAGRVLLVCAKSKDQPPRLVAYDISEGRGSGGDYRFFNFSPTAISAIFGERKFGVKPGGDMLVSDPAWKTEVLEIDVQLATVTEGKAKSVYSSVWGHRPGRRNFVFLLASEQAYKPVKICRFFDVPTQAAGGSPNP